MDLRVMTTAVVTIKVEVQLSLPWGPKCELGQVFKQAKQDAVDDVEQKLTGSKYRIVGVPVVKAVLVEEGRP